MVYDVLGKKRLYFDGAMGTVLQAKGIKLGELPESYNYTKPEVIEEIHREYLEAGADFITTNTFGANRYKLRKTEYTVEGMILKATELANKARKGYEDKYIALDIGSTGKVLKPIGDVSFEEVYDVFKEQVIAGTKAGCDVILFETFTDLYELKAGILAAKENSQLPIFCTMSFEENGRTFFGSSVESMVLTLEALGVDALGVNCSLGPKELKPIIEKITQMASIPILVQPNAGLPVMKDGGVYYDITEEAFADYMEAFAKMGVSLLGGCCGTSSRYIKATVEKTKTIPYCSPEPKAITGICSNGQAVYFDDVRIIGERLNPTGKKLLQQALRNEDMDYILNEAMQQEKQGAHILDVNVGLPDIDEVAMLKEVIMEVQATVKLPLQIDSSNPEALEEAARIYNGKSIINSVNGKKESLDTILPIAKKYGACILGLTLDETGIPASAEERLAVAKRIVEAALEIGIPRKDILIDCLVVTASAQQDLVIETLKAVRLVKEQLGVKTVLGVSNVSFGLPNRPAINKTMLGMALMQGLDAPIMNPGDQGMLETIRAYRVLVGKDKDSKDYIAGNTQVATEDMVRDTKDKREETIDLQQAIITGLKEAAANATKSKILETKPLEIIEQEIVPALNKVGELYEKQSIFLPQLIKSAEAAKRAFEVLQNAFSKEEGLENTNKTKVALATVYGDIHDIGKNIVKVIMENYNFEVYDLGKDVPTEVIIEAVQRFDIKIVGLSALMTTTVASMKATIKALKQKCPHVKVIVGGAVLTPELADFVEAHHYAKDAMETVRIAEKIK